MLTSHWMFNHTECIFSCPPGLIDWINSVKLHMNWTKHSFTISDSCITTNGNSPLSIRKCCARCFKVLVVVMGWKRKKLFLWPYRSGHFKNVAWTVSNSVPNTEARKKLTKMIAMKPSWVASGPLSLLEKCVLQRCTELKCLWRLQTWRCVSYLHLPRFGDGSFLEGWINLVRDNSRNGSFTQNIVTPIVAI